MTSPPARTDGTDDRRREALTAFAREPFVSLLGARLEVDDAGGVALRMQARAELLNEVGLLHGGAVFALADTCFAYICRMAGAVAVTRSAEIIFVAPVADGDELVATGREIARFGRNVIVDVSVRAAHDPVAEIRVYGSEQRA
jgi:acyl-CoA thioesterase